MKSLRSTGSVDRGAGGLEVARCCPGKRRVGQHRQAGGAAVADRRGPAPAGRNPARISPPEGEAFLISAISPKPAARRPPPSARRRSRAAVGGVGGAAAHRLQAGRPPCGAATSARVSAQMPPQRVASVGGTAGRLRLLGHAVSRRSVSSAASAAPPSSAAAASATPSRSSPARPATIRPAAAFSSTVSRYGPRGAAQQRRQGGGVHRGVAAADGGDRRARQAGVLGRHGEARGCAPSRSATTWFSPATVSSSSPWPCTSQQHSVPSEAERLGHRPRPGRVEHAGELAAHPGRVGQRAEQVEDRAGAELDARPGGVAQRRVVARREQEGAMGGAQDAGQPLQRHVDVHAERGQHVGPAGARGQRPVAVLGHRHAPARPARR